MSKAWGQVGAWALDAERAEAEELAAASAAAAAPPPSAAPADSFPSLKEAAAAGKPKKKKPIAVPLSQFATGTYVGPGGAARSSSTNLIEPRGLTHDEILRLPTGPRERSEEELGGYGRGFRSYGLSGGPSRGGYDEQPRGRGGPERRAPPPSEFDQPSRADEVDNWAAAKKPLPPPDRDRYGSLGGGSSRANEVDNWGAAKKPLSARSFGSGIRDSHTPSAGPDSDRWVRGIGFGGSNGEPRDRPRLILDPPKKNITNAEAASETAKNRPSPFGVARPREEVLAEKGLDWKKIDTEIDSKKSSRPTSSQSNRPSSVQSNRPGTPGSEAEDTMKPKPKVNPFGDAKPREIVLKEKGKDWRKMDLELEHRRIDRPETAEEKFLKEEIDRLYAVAKEPEGSLNTEELATVRDELVRKERDLEMLIRDFDDKVRFAQNISSDTGPGSGAGRPGSGAGRPGSRSGRIAISMDRPPSQSGRPDETRVVDFMERPRSRGGMGESWSRSMEGRGFQRGRERGFFNNRNVDRSSSGERW